MGYRRAIGIVLALAALRLILESTPLASGAEREFPGRVMFERSWTRGDLASKRGDGLGPMFNARSCAACHHQQGSGGGGDNTHNVDLLTVVDFESDSKQAPPRTPLETLHPGFVAANSVTLHAASTSDRYASYRESLLGTKKKSLVRSVSVQRTSDYDGQEYIEWGAFKLQHSQRNTPSLFGASQIDAISDRTLAELALGVRDQHAEADSSEFIRPPVARFGWKNQSVTLRDFVVGACANELGLQSKGSPQPLDPSQPSYRHKWVDMNDGQINKLVSFVASLPAPRRLPPKDERELTSLERGALLFGLAKCHACHVPDVDHARGIYSDLQLHNMGPSLADPSGRALTLSQPQSARSNITLITEPDPADEPNNPDSVFDSNRPFGGAPYYGPTVVDLAAKWRTPPLWGVRYTAPYLHDGRAATLDEAIKMHDGEAAKSAMRYGKMTEEERGNLVKFVYSLGAP